MTSLSSRLQQLSPERLKLLIDQMKAKGMSELDLPIYSIARNSTIPLSYAQERLWIVEQLDPGNPGYHISVPLRLEGRFHVDALLDAMTKIIFRHEALRTTFPSKEGIPVQIVHPPSPARIEMVDLTQYNVDERLAVALELASAQAIKAFDLTAGPLYRLWMAKLESEDHILVVTIHHIIADNWSMGILIKELEENYVGFLNGIASNVSDLPIQYADFSAWQRSVLFRRTMDNQIAYWKNKLKGIQAPIHIPSDFHHQALTSFNGARKIFTVDCHSISSLRNITSSKGATLFMGVLSTYALVLNRFSGAENIIIGVDVAGRNRPEIELLFGFFVNQLVIPVKINETSSYCELVEQVRESCIEAYENQDVPFQNVVEAVQKQRGNDRTPLFEVKLVYLDFPMNKGPNFPGIKTTVLALKTTNRFRLELICWESESGLECMLEYNADLYNDETIENFKDCLLRTIISITTFPEGLFSSVLLDNNTTTKRTRVIIDDFEF